MFNLPAARARRHPQAMGPAHAVHVLKESGHLKLQVALPRGGLCLSRWMCAFMVGLAALLLAWEQMPGDLLHDLN